MALTSEQKAKIDQAFKEAGISKAQPPSRKSLFNKTQQSEMTPKKGVLEGRENETATGRFISGFKEGVKSSDESLSALNKSYQEGKIGAPRLAAESAVNFIGKTFLPAARGVSEAISHITDPIGKYIINPAVEGSVKTMEAITKPAVKALTKSVGEKNIEGFQEGLKKKLSDPEIQRTVKNLLQAGEGGLAIVDAFTAGSSLGAIKNFLKKGIKEGVIPKSGFDIQKETMERLLKENTEKKAAEAVKNEALSEIKEGVSTGLSKPDVKRITSADEGTKTAFERQFNIAEQTQGQRGADTRPIQVAGEDLTKRAEFLQKQRNTVGANKARELEKLPDNPIDITEQVDSFMESLEKKGIKVGENGLDFTESIIRNDKAAQDAINKVIDDFLPDATGKVLMTPQQIERARQRIFYDLDLDIPKAFKDFAKTTIEPFRTNVFKPLEKLSPRLARLNKEYATMTDALKKFVNYLGYKGRLDDISRDSLRAGEIASRILGNASARPKEVIEKLLDISKKAGYKAPADFKKLVEFSDFLEDLFGITQTRGFQSGIERGVKNVAEGVDIATDIVGGGAKGKVSALSKIVQKVTGKTKEDQIEAVRRLLKSAGQQPQ